jgi:hypothetical protein
MEWQGDARAPSAYESEIPPFECPSSAVTDVNYLYSPLSLKHTVDHAIEARLLPIERKGGGVAFLRRRRASVGIVPSRRLNIFRKIEHGVLSVAFFLGARGIHQIHSQHSAEKSPPLRTKRARMGHPQCRASLDRTAEGGCPHINQATAFLCGVDAWVLAAGLARKLVKALLTSSACVQAMLCGPSLMTTSSAPWIRLAVRCPAAANGTMRSASP